MGVTGVRAQFCEASGDRLVRWDGNSEELVQLAKTNGARLRALCWSSFFTRGSKLCADLPTVLAIGAGHSFIIFLRNAVRTSAHDTQCLLVPLRTITLTQPSLVPRERSSTPSTS
jgi:adenosine/AMP kinase